ncbi:TPA: anti-phage protein KwaB, partial [Vibrio cholerae]
QRGFAKFVDTCDGVSVYFVDDSNEVYDSDISSTTLSKFRDSFCAQLRTNYTENDNFSLLALSNYDERNSALFQYDFSPSEMPFEFKLTKKVLDLKATQPLPTYQAKHNKLSNIRASIVLLTSSVLNKSIAFYQYIFPVSLLGSDKGILNVTTHNTRLIELEQDVLKLNANFVFFQIDSKYFIENVNTLETRLHFKEVIHKRAENYAKKIEELGLVEDMTKFNDRISKETGFARKLVKVYKNSAVIKGNIPNKDIVSFAMSKPYYSDSLRASDTGDSFKLDSIVKCKRFVELLDDDFLKSELTNRHYIARAKDLVG